MNFELTPEQKLLRDTVRSFCKQKSPVERFRRLREDKRGWDPEVWAHMGELGWLSLPLPESAGGFGGDFGDVAILLEGFGKTLVPEPYIPSVVLAGMAVAEAGDDAQCERWLPAMMEGKTSLALAHTEVGSRFGTDEVAATATRDGGGWRLRGTKVWVLNGHRADQIVVSARADGGVGLFVVDGDAVRRTDVRTIDSHGAARIELDLVVDGDRCLGAPGPDAEGVLDRVLDYGAAACCAEALGVCQATLDMTKEHLKTREQFGVPIGMFQVLQHYAVDMFVQIELIRSMSLLAAAKAGESNADERRAAISAAKAHVAWSGRAVTQKAIQLHGGIGITDEHDVGLYFKRMHALGLLFGDETHHVRRFATSPTFAV
jgi:alkylation response protein AidB-like acyl-CoA dehydrogenase